MILRLFFSSTHLPVSGVYNGNFDVVMYQLWILKGRGTDIEIIDTSSMSIEEIQAAYRIAQIPAIAKKRSIRMVFGTKHRCGFRFGKEVPSLLIYEDAEGRPIDVYPHIRKWGVVMTIQDFLRDLSGYGGHFAGRTFSKLAAI